MLNMKSYKKVIIAVLALTMILGTAALAAESIYQKELTATYGRIKFNYEGSDVTSQIEDMYGAPAFVADGKSYVPVRAIGDLVGVDVDYDNDTHTVKITDPKVAEHRKQLDEKNDEIAKLKAKIEKLENTVKEEPKKEEVIKKDLKSLQATLNKKYSEYEKVEFDIVLKESNNKISIDINTNLANTRDDQNWIRMNYSNKKYLMEDVVSQVKKEFKDADITGNIYDSFSRRNLHTFRLNTNGTVTITNNEYGGYNDGYYNDGYYNGYYDGSSASYAYREFSDYGITNARLSDYGLRYDSFKISFSQTDNNSEKWTDLKNGSIQSVLDRISREIEYEYGLDYNRYIYIEIEKGSTIVGTYERDLLKGTGTFTAKPIP